MEKASLFLVILSLSSCLFDYSYTKQITGPYELSAVDEKEAMSIYADDKGVSGIGIIGRTVFAIGYNEDYIIAKQHPDNDKSIINYYIIPLKYNVNRVSSIDENKIGPLTSMQFDLKRKELKIDQVKFSIVFHDLE